MSDDFLDDGPTGTGSDVQATEALRAHFEIHRNRVFFARYGQNYVEGSAVTDCP